MEHFKELTEWSINTTEEITEVEEEENIENITQEETLQAIRDETKTSVGKDDDIQNFKIHEWRRNSAIHKNNKCNCYRHENTEPIE